MGILSLPIEAGARIESVDVKKPVCNVWLAGRVTVMRAECPPSDPRTQLDPTKARARF